MVGSHRGGSWGEGSLAFGLEKLRGERVEYASHTL